MITKKVTKLIGLKKTDFDDFLSSGQIQAQSARLIPVLKTGDEMALTSIFLSSLRLIKEYRDSIFKQIKLSRNGRIHYYTEVCIPDHDNSRIDGLIIVVSKGSIVDAAFFEMKNKANSISEEQITKYIDLCKAMKVKKLVTISNEFVTDPTQSPIKIKVPKAISLSHFSWTYLLTTAQLLLFKNDLNIQDDDQIEVMKEVLHYLENPQSGVKGYTQMKAGWKQLAENVRASNSISQSEEYVQEAVLSWHEEEADLALLLSRKLGVLVKLRSRDIKSDLKKVTKENVLTSTLNIKDSASDIKIISDFNARIVSMSVSVTPPQDKGTVARITWIGKQLENCAKKADEVFNGIAKEIWVEVDVRYVRSHLRVALSDIGSLQEVAKGKDIQAFNIVMIRSFGANFASVKKFVELLEKMTLSYYEGIVQHLTNWVPKAPKIVED